MYAVATVVALVLLVWVFVQWRSVKVYRFYKDSCGYCVKSAAEWDQFKQHCKFSFVKCIDIDTADAKNEAICKNFDIRTIPTIYKVTPEGCRYLFEADRSLNNYKKFV